MCQHKIKKSLITCQDGLQSLELAAAIGSAGQLVALALDLNDFSASGSPCFEENQQIQDPGPLISM